MRQLDKEAKGKRDQESIEFGERIKKIRKTLRMRQDEFSLRIGLSQRTLSYLEKGERELSVKLAKRISEAFNVNYIWISYGSGDMFNAKPEIGGGGGKSLTPYLMRYFLKTKQFNTLKEDKKHRYNMFLRFKKHLFF